MDVLWVDNDVFNLLGNSGRICLRAIPMATRVGQRRWRVVLEQDPETGEWAAWCPELPGCASAGETEADALENIREAIALYLQPDEIPLAPSAVQREVIV